MKKADVVETVDGVGTTVRDLYSTMWSTALNPSQHGWPASALSIGCIPLVNIALLGHFVASVIVTETPDSVYEALPDFGKK